MIKPIVPRHLLVAASAWASRIVMAFVQLASIRVLMSGLGIEQYAAYALLAALMGWFMLADFGIGLSLQNHISERRSKTEQYDDYIILAVAMAAILLILTIIALYFSSPYIAPIYLKQFPLLTTIEKTRLFFITGALFICAALGGISYKIWYAEQRGYFSNVLPAISSVVGYVGIVAVNSSTLTDKLLYSLVAFLAPSAVLPLGVLVVQVWRRFRDGIKEATFEIAIKILKRATNFWLLTLMTSLSLQIDYLVISQFLKPADIVVYNLSTRISWFILFIYISALTALWPVFSEAIAQGNWVVVRRLTRKYLEIGLGFTLICSLLLVWLMPMAVQVLAPNETIVIPVMFILLLGIYQLLRVWTDTFAMILQSMSELKPLWIAGPIQAFLSVVSQWYLAQSLGLYGIILGNTLSFALTSSWLLPLAVNAHYKKHVASQKPIL
ncbi:MATE family efflux transporter [Sulfuricella sp.]|uniref:MATE family efflux transporter n=1 Tax=Sulfuricella sp. TaxID=2099377 RepID=UPI002C37D83B|nr:MATE family efflux transporter [Sulfuricella sp.]HUX65240.1 MATE family efflux transporter [Sulfuricella sp.]